MTIPSARPPLAITAERDRDVVRLRLVGDLAYETTEGLLRRVYEQLAGRPRQVRLDCSGVGFCDTMGLSGLLEIRRATSAIGCELYLDDRPPQLQRLLDITCTLEYLTGEPATTAERSSDG